MPYSFLSQPPQLKQKRRPVPPVNVVPIPVIAIAEQSSPTALPATFVASIQLWAQAVQPGTPAPRSPPSPYRNRRRSSVSSLRRPRRPSVSHASSSFLHLVDTPTTSSSHKKTPSVKDLTFDLTNLGYTSLFVPLPDTPVTPSLIIPSSNSKSGGDDIPSPAPAPTLKRVRSLGVLKFLRRPLAKSTSRTNGPPSPTRTKSKTKAAKVKKIQPPTLTNELLLLQFMDGGSIESNLKRVMKKQATNAAKNASAQVAVDDVHRDGKDGYWRDQDEEMEYKPLLPTQEGDGWVQPDDGAVPSPKTKKAARKRPAPLNLVGAACSSRSGFADSFAPASAPASNSALLCYRN